MPNQSNCDSKNGLTLPLLVDLDGTLIHSDTLWESLALGLRHPLKTLSGCLGIFSGKAALKEKLATYFMPTAELLPYRKHFCDYLRAEFAEGRKLYLITGANTKIASAVAAHLGIFSGVFASDQNTNLVGRKKAELACSKFGERGFVYAGNETQDFHIWAKAAAAIVIDCDPVVQRRLEKQGIPLEYSIAKPAGLWWMMLKALRPHQWAKNALVFVPAILGHRLTDTVVLLSSAIAFLAISSMASALYIFNDLADLQADRLHVHKCKRPFASGLLSIPLGLAMSVALLLIAFVVSCWLPANARMMLGVYAACSLAYSFKVKNLMAMDIVLLASLYALRIFLGGMASGIVISVWTLAFSLFVFIALALVKRLTDLNLLEESGTSRLPGRPYYIEDIPVITALACASAYSAVLVFGLYINSPEVRLLYSHPQFLWMIIPFLVYWVTRFIIITHRSQMHHDPVVFALSDKASWFVFLALLCIIATAK